MRTRRSGGFFSPPSPQKRSKNTFFGWNTWSSSHGSKHTPPSVVRLSGRAKSILQKKDATHNMLSAKSNYFLGWKSGETNPVLSGHKMRSSEVDQPHLYPSPSRCYGKDLHKYNLYRSNKTLRLQ